MKISVFFDNYLPFHELKDLGQIPLGLLDAGVDAAVVTVEKPELADYHPRFGLLQKPLEAFFSGEFWEQDNSDVILSYPIYRMGYSEVLSKMKAAGKGVILKFDSDGKLGYPHMRHTHRIPLRERFTLGNLASETYWYIASSSMKRKKHAGFAAEVIRQMEFADAAVIESPQALENLQIFLSYWGRSDLAKKAVFIPNPVTPEFVEGEVGAKENLAVAHGRWDDFTVKNTAAMAASAAEFLKLHPDWRFMIFGSGIELVKKYLEKAPAEVKSCLQLSEFVPHNEVKDKLASAKLLFVPSRWESFSISSGEALCVGCSVAGTPLESLQYLTNGGFSGTLATSFKAPGILAALLEDAKKWDNDEYDSKGIAAFWRPKLDRKAVAKSIVNLAQPR